MRTRPNTASPEVFKKKPGTSNSRRDKQIVRILALLRMLAQGGSPTVHELAAEFHTRRETIYRDLKALQEVGYPIGGDEHGRLSRPRLLSFPVPEIRFLPTELEALLLASVQAQPALPDEDSLSTAVLKLKALGESASDSIPLGFEGMVEAWHCGSKDYRKHERWITLLIEAILRKRRCQVEYNTPGRTTPKRYDLDPYCLLLVGGGIYVVGRVPKHTRVGTFAVDRLVSLALSDTPFEVDSTFDLQKCRQDAFGVSWSDPMEIVLHFRAEQAPYVRERMWHPSQQITDLPDGGVRLTFRPGGLFEIRRWILGWGDAVEVIEPESLHHDIREALQSALLAYGTDHGIDGPTLG